MLNRKTTKSSLWAYKWPNSNELRSQTRQHYEKFNLRISVPTQVVHQM